MIDPMLVPNIITAAVNPGQEKGKKSSISGEWISSVNNTISKLGSITGAVNVCLNVDGYLFKTIV